jgi:4-hydroxy-3-methylbut-2-enyl diphosphate reductase
MQKAALTILLAAPRGFCAGVDRAIQIVELALEKYGAPVYVRHEIVHNRFVVENLERRGAIFVDELDEVPQEAHVIFSAHGVAKSVPQAAQTRHLHYVDATCPLVSKVHREAERHHEEDRHVIMLGHAGHPETVGTMGQLPDGAISLVETVEDAETVAAPAAGGLAYITQTTLSVDDTATMIDRLRQRFPDIAGPRNEDICYATTNRQGAVKVLAPRCDAFIVVGAPNSSNSKRLVEVAKGLGCDNAQLVQRAGDIDWQLMTGVATIGVSAGASAPEVLVEEVIDAFRGRYDVSLEEVAIAQEDMHFKLPRELRPQAG